MRNGRDDLLVEVEIGCGGDLKIVAASWDMVLYN